MEDKTPLINNDEEELVKVVYASINFKDVMIASGKLIGESITSIERNSNYSLGLEFVGFDKNGQRIMGLCSTG